MPAGSNQFIIMCQANGTTGNSTVPCMTVAGIRYRPVMVQTYILDPSSASYIDAIATPYNYAQGGALWAFGFSFVLATWFLARNIGLILDAVKRF